MKTKHIVCPYCAVDRDKLEASVEELAKVLRHAQLVVPMLKGETCTETERCKLLAAINDVLSAI